MRSFPVLCRCRNSSQPLTRAILPCQIRRLDCAVLSPGPAAGETARWDENFAPAKTGCRAGWPGDSAEVAGPGINCPSQQDFRSAMRHFEKSAKIRRDRPTPSRTDVQTTNSKPARSTSSSCQRNCVPKNKCRVLGSVPSGRPVVTSA